MKQSIALAVLALPLTVSAECHKADYARLRDMPMEELARRYCQARHDEQTEKDAARELFHAAGEQNPNKSIAGEQISMFRASAHMKNANQCADLEKSIANVLKDVHHQEVPQCAQQ